MMAAAKKAKNLGCYML